jgi:hypothetical protein
MNRSNNKGSSGGSKTPSSEPQVITGWHHSTYANNGSKYSQERYAYIGKDSGGEPQWLDYGRKGDR